MYSDVLLSFLCAIYERNRQATHTVSKLKDTLSCLVDFDEQAASKKLPSYVLDFIKPESQTANFEILSASHFTVWILYCCPVSLQFCSDSSVVS